MSMAGRFEVSSCLVIGIQALFCNRLSIISVSLIDFDWQDDSAAMLQACDGDFDDIVNQVLRMRPHIEAGRQYTVQTPSVIRAEFTREIDALNELRAKFKANIRNEEDKQQKKLD